MNDWMHCMKPYKCPICNGTGIVPGGFYFSVNGYSTSTNTTEMCRQCQGIGIIWGVEDCNHEAVDMVMERLDALYGDR